MAMTPARPNVDHIIEILGDKNINENIFIDDWAKELQNNVEKLPGYPSGRVILTTVLAGNVVQQDRILAAAWGQVQVSPYSRLYLLGASIGGKLVAQLSTLIFKADPSRVPELVCCADAAFDSTAATNDNDPSMEIHARLETLVIYSPLTDILRPIMPGVEHNGPVNKPGVTNINVSVDYTKEVDWLKNFNLAQELLAKERSRGFFHWGHPNFEAAESCALAVHYTAVEIGLGIGKEHISRLLTATSLPPR